jgi:hypothetical protein
LSYLAENIGRIYSVAGTEEFYPNIMPWRILKTRRL